MRCERRVTVPIKKGSEIESSAGESGDDGEGDGK